MPRKPDTMQIAIAGIEYHKALNRMTDKELYERAGIKRSTYWDRMGRRSRAFDLCELDRIARVLKITVVDLVARQG